MAQKQRLAVLIDAENVSASAADRLFVEIARLGKSKKRRRLYGNLNKPQLKAWVSASLKHKIDARSDAPHAKGKNVTDFTFVIDALDMLYTKDIDAFCIISRDSDFAGLAKYIREKGKRVYGLAGDQTPKTLRAQCDELIDLKKPTK
jgi:predicted nuclease of predicted toxin-antitoxin system